MEKNIFITGIPRSGTSLLTFLFSNNRDYLCFSEPAFVKRVKKNASTKKEVVVALEKEINDIRKKIANGVEINIRLSKGNEVPDNYFQRSAPSSGQVEKTSELKYVIFSPEVALKNFVIKNNLLFTSCLEELIGLGDVLATVRHPLHTLLSWNSLDIPVSKGNVYTGEKFSQSLNELPSRQNLLLRQIKIIDWFYAKYTNNHVCLIKYEDLVVNPKQVLSPWFKDVKLPKLKSKNEIKRYTQENTQLIEHYLEKHSVLYNEVYK
ncbi:MAG: sulfotransferase [Marinicella sp.]